MAAKFTYRAKRVKGETLASGTPLWIVQELKAGRISRQWFGTRDEMSDLRKRATAAQKRPNPWPVGKWIKATAVRLRREAGRVVMDKR